MKGLQAWRVFLVPMVLAVTGSIVWAAEVKEDDVELVVIDGSDHFPRDVYANAVVEAVQSSPVGE